MSELYAKLLYSFGLYARADGQQEDIDNLVLTIRYRTENGRITLLFGQNEKSGGWNEIKCVVKIRESSGKGNVFITLCVCFLLIVSYLNATYKGRVAYMTFTNYFSPLSIRNVDGMLVIETPYINDASVVSKLLVNASSYMENENALVFTIGNKFVNCFDLSGNAMSSYTCNVGVFLPFESDKGAQLRQLNGLLKGIQYAEMPLISTASSVNPKLPSKRQEHATTLKDVLIKYHTLTPDQFSDFMRRTNTGVDLDKIPVNETEYLRAYEEVQPLVLAACVGLLVGIIVEGSLLTPYGPSVKGGIKYTGNAAFRGSLSILKQFMQWLLGFGILQEMNFLYYQIAIAQATGVKGVLANLIATPLSARDTARSAVDLLTSEKGMKEIAGLFAAFLANTSMDKFGPGFNWKNWSLIGDFTGRQISDMAPVYVSQLYHAFDMFIRQAIGYPDEIPSSFRPVINLFFVLVVGVGMPNMIHGAISLVRAPTSQPIEFATDLPKPLTDSIPFTYALVRDTREAMNRVLIEMSKLPVLVEPTLTQVQIRSRVFTSEPERERLKEEMQKAVAILHKKTLEEARVCLANGKPVEAARVFIRGIESLQRIK